MRMYADEEEERSRKRKLQSRLSKGSQESSSLSIAKSRPVHSRLGQVAGARSSDLRQRLGSTKNSDDPGYDQENSDSSDGFVAEKSKVDLRTKLKGRTSAK